jgi:HEAT repeat protein
MITDRQDQLINQLGSHILIDRIAAFNKLIAMGTDVVPKLIQGLHHDNPYVRSWTAQALGKIGDETAIAPLLKATKDVVGDVRSKAIESLSRMKKLPQENFETMLLEALGDDNPIVRASAASALGRFSSDKVVEQLCRTLSDSWYEVRESAAFALGEIENPRSVESLINSLQDDYVWVQVNCINALGKIGDARAIAPLINAAKDPNPEVSLRAIQALRQIRR